MFTLSSERCVQADADESHPRTLPDLHKKFLGRLGPGEVPKPRRAAARRSSGQSQASRDMRGQGRGGDEDLNLQPYTLGLSRILATDAKVASAKPGPMLFSGDGTAVY